MMVCVYIFGLVGTLQNALLRAPINLDGWLSGPHIENHFLAKTVVGITYDLTSTQMVISMGYVFYPYSIKTQLAYMRLKTS